MYYELIFSFFFRGIPGHAEIVEESGSEKFSIVKEMSVMTPSPVKRTSTPGYAEREVRGCVFAYRYLIRQY